MTEREIVDAMCDRMAADLTEQAVHAMSAHKAASEIAALRPRLYARMIEVAEDRRAEFEAQVRRQHGGLH